MDAQGLNYFDRLPNEAQLEILKYLDINELGNTGAVDSKMASLANDDGLWRRLGSQIGLSERSLKANPKGAVKQEVERLRAAAKKAGIAKADQSVKKLLKQPPTVESLQTLVRWPEARTTFIVFKKLSKEFKSKNPIQPNILQSENWADIPQLYAAWSEENKENLKSVTSLDLRGKQISSLPRGLFQNLQNLEELNLSENQILSFNKEDFDDLKNLKKLDLSRNQIDHLAEGGPKALANLTELDLSTNQIRSLGKEFISMLKKLETLNLSNNKIRDLPKDKFENPLQLLNLNLSGNSIRSFDEEFLTALVNLKELKLSNNEKLWLKEENIQFLKNLERIDLSFIPDISDEVFDLLKNQNVKVETEKG